jgi:hypothetical protein
LLPPLAAGAALRHDEFGRLWSSVERVETTATQTVL